MDIRRILPWFILGFLAMAGVRSTGLVPQQAVGSLAFAAKFCMCMALAAIGLKTSLREVAGVGIKPMVAGVIIDTSVVFVSLFAQAAILRFLN